MNLRIPFILLLSVALCDHTNAQSLQELLAGLQETLQNSPILQALANVTEAIQEAATEAVETINALPLVQAVNNFTETVQEAATEAVETINALPLVQAVNNFTETVAETFANSTIGQAVNNITEALAPPGLDLDAICDGLIDQISAITESIDVPIPPEFEGFEDKILCTCGFVVAQIIIELECVYADEICIPLGDDELCGEPTFGGVYDININPNVPDELNSKACFTFTSDTTISDLCIEVDHGASFLGIATLETCEIYALRSDGTQDPCTCEICDAPSLQLTFDCSGVDLDEDEDKEFILPNFLMGECFGARVGEAPVIFDAIITGSRE